MLYLVLPLPIQMHQAILSDMSTTQLIVSPLMTVFLPVIVTQFVGNENTSVLLKIFVNQQIKRVALLPAIITEYVIQMNHVTVLIVMVSQIIVISLHENRCSVVMLGFLLARELPLVSIQQ